MRMIGRFGGAAFALIASIYAANAQNAFPTPQGSNTGSAAPMCRSTANSALFVPCDATNPLPVAATASISGFAPGGAFATLTATGSSASVALPAGAVVVFNNIGTTAVSCTLGVGSATAIASENIIQPGSWFAFTVGSNTFGACIDQTGSASNVVVLSGGTGLPTGSGGGSSGGGGGASTIADGADVAEGTTTDGACAGDATSGCTVLSRLSRIAARLTTLIAQTASGVAQGSTTSGQTGQLVQCAVTTAAPSYTTAQTDPLSCDTTGNLRVNVVTATGLAQGSTTSGQTGSMIMGAVTTSAPTYTTAQTSPLSLTTAGDLRTVFSNTTLAVTNAGTFAVQIAANSSVNAAQWGGTTVVNGGTAGIVGVGGSTATNVALTDNPINNGAQAVSSENAAVTTARKVQLVADLVGKLIVLPYANPENFVSGTITSAMTGTASTSLIAAPAAGLRNYITQCTVSNSHATVGTDMILQDGSGGTTIYVIPAAAAFGGASITFPTPLRQPTTATALFIANVTTGSNTKASCSGYKGA